MRCGEFEYIPRKPEETVRSQVIAEQLETFLARRQEQERPLPVDQVIPSVPTRQWVLSLPFKLRYRMAYDSKLMGEILNIFVRTVFGKLRRRAQEALGLKRT